MTDKVLAQTGFRFNRIFLVESLPEGDLRTGEALYDDVLAPGAASGQGPKSHYFPVFSREEFLDIIHRIAEEASEKAVLPLLHIDAHGGPEGLQLADQSLIDWKLLSSELLKINIACQMNLVVVASMCHGWFLMDGVLPSVRSPIFAVIGPPAEISAGALVDAVRRFYVEAVQSSDLEKALGAMNSGVDFKDWPIKPGLAEVLFCRAFREFWAGDEIETIAKDRENLEVAILVKRYDLTLSQSAEARLSVCQTLSDPRFWYEELRRRFLMLDIFPANHARFGITWELCKSGT